MKFFFRDLIVMFKALSIKTITIGVILRSIDGFRELFYSSIFLST